MSDGKIHIPARRKKATAQSGSVAVKVTQEAYNAVVEIYNESTLSMTQIISKIIMESLDRIVYDKEDE